MTPPVSVTAFCGAAATQNLQLCVRVRAQDSVLKNLLQTSLLILKGR